ncbi:LacI family DNA-binding transcriptional regulator [Nonomuraea ceibae]|uniref:LacI family DNA-binding transcriptional regulator n=1 Tax=Nonomuraea ceibae TaxID=1935170 RepID=UPI001C5F873D|nr:LacI family DNA-binding transcriptional regulator [Nonomuraea ceibae]
MSNGPTLKGLAAIIGISPTAVSMALNGRPGVSDELRERVRAIAEEQGYRPNFAARALRVERSNMLGLISRNLSNPGYLRLIDGFSGAAEEHGYQILIGTSDLDRSRETSMIRAMTNRQLDGLAIAPIDGEAVLETWQGKSDRPMVLVNSARSARSSGVMSIRGNASQAVRLAVDHLLELGHRRIALLTNPGLSSASERVSLFRRMMRAAGLPSRVVSGSAADETIERVVRALAKADRPTAVITDSDLLAHYVYDAAIAAGLRIPGDLSVVGHDDLPTSHLLGPALTTIAVDRFEIGRQAATMLIGALNGDEIERPHRELPVELKVRKSTARPAG